MIKNLTKRELEVARLKACGLADKEIARELGISYGTVRTHIDKVNLKLGCVNITHSVGILKDLKKI